MLIKSILLMLSIATLRAGYYLYYFLRGKRYLQIYKKYLNDQDDASHTKLSEVAGQIKQLFRLAGLEKATIPYVEPLGLGHVSTGHATPVDNLGNLREDIVKANLGMFSRAIGTCRSKSINSFNPILWGEFLVYLPTKLLDFLNIKSTNIFVKLLQIIWWLFVAVATVVGVVFNDNFTKWLQAHL